MTLDPDEARALLREERDRAAARHRAAEAAFAGDDAPERSVTGEHPGDAATEINDREVAQTSLEHAHTELVEIDAALARLDDGSYGHCEADGEPIDPERLRAKPAARFCTAHQEQAEARA